MTGFTVPHCDMRKKLQRLPQAAFLGTKAHVMAQTFVSFTDCSIDVKKVPVPSRVVKCCFWRLIRAGGTSTICPLAN